MRIVKGGDGTDLTGGARPAGGTRGSKLMDDG